MASPRGDKTSKFWDSDFENDYLSLFLAFISLRKKCLYLELLWSVFSRIRTEYGMIRSISPYSIRMREDTDQNNSEYGKMFRQYFLLLLVHEILDHFELKILVNDVTTEIKTTIFRESDLRNKLLTSKFDQILISIYLSPLTHDIKFWAPFT